jgi:Fe2+ or Zn2+ uptake regulation protein
MAMSTCPKCDSHKFEMKGAEPDGSKFKVMFIQCASCGAVIGITDYYNIPSLLAKIAKKMGFNIYE